MANRKYFGTDGIRGKVGEKPISADFVLKLGWALGRVLAQKKPGKSKVIIGKDTRISGYMFESALESGLSAAGCDILLLGPMPTPAVAYLTRTFKAQAGIVISASHNPHCDNGIKFFSEDGTKISDEFELAIEQQLEQPMTTVDSILLGKASRVTDAQGRYIEYCKSTFPYNFDLKGLKIVVDCANGATYQVAPNVYSELGAEIKSINSKPDGININENCGATSPEGLVDAVKNAKADVGIALDGDGDRVIMVDDKGEILDGDQLLYIIAKYYESNDLLKGGVVGTVMSNIGLELAFKSAATEFVRTKVGDRYIVEELKKKNWILGGESSGHILCLDSSSTGDGIVSSLKVLAALIQENKSLNEIKQGMVKYPQTLVNVKVSSKDNILNNVNVNNAVQKATELLKEQGRVLLRASGTESLIRVMVEGVDQVLVSTVAKDIAKVVEANS